MSLFISTTQTKRRRWQFRPRPGTMWEHRTVRVHLGQSRWSNLTPWASSGLPHRSPSDPFSSYPLRSSNLRRISRSGERWAADDVPNATPRRASTSSGPAGRQPGWATRCAAVTDDTRPLQEMWWFMTKILWHFNRASQLHTIYDEFEGMDPRPRTLWRFIEFVIIEPTKYDVLLNSS